MVQLKEIAVLATIATIAQCQPSVANPNGRGVYARHAAEALPAAQGNPWEKKYMAAEGQLSAEDRKYQKLDTSFEAATRKPKLGAAGGEASRRVGERPLKYPELGAERKFGGAGARERLGEVRPGEKGRLGARPEDPMLHKDGMALGNDRSMLGKDRSMLSKDRSMLSKDGSMLSKDNSAMRTDSSEIKKLQSELGRESRLAGAKAPTPYRRQNAMVGMNRMGAAPAARRRSVEPYYGSVSQRDLYARAALPEAYAMPAYDDGLYARDAYPEPYYEDAPLSKRDMNELLARDPEHLSERDIEFLAASLTERDLHELMAREAEPEAEPEFDGQGLHARDAEAEPEAEFEDQGLYAREAEAEFEEHELWARDAEAEAEAEAYAEAEAEEDPLFPRDMAFMDAVKRMIGMNNKE